MSAHAPDARVDEPLRTADAVAVAAFVDDALARAGAEGRSVFVALPAPARAADVSLDTVLAIGAELTGVEPGGFAPASFLFSPPRARDELEAAGWGAAIALEARGPERFAVLRREAERLGASLARFTHPAAGAPPSPRLFGGLAFEDTPRDPWRGFDGASFVLPRIALVREGARVHLVVAASAAEAASVRARRALVSEVEAAWSHLAVPRAPVPSTPASVRATRRREPDFEGWVAELSAIRRAIGVGALEKAVAARRTVLDAERPWAVATVLAALEHAPSRPSTLRFAFEREGSTFLGLTPERLVRKRGAEVVTEAVAGSAPATESAERWLHTAKTEEEHQIVVRMIRVRLAGLADDVVARAPEHRPAGPIVHLVTPLSARVAEGTHVLAIAEALHPTPAVCGWPVDAARRLLAEEEPWSRGWYAGPVGWLDLAGDGELFVALRSALSTGARVITFAGAGIVRGSEASAEWAEIGLKEATILRALGVEP